MKLFKESIERLHYYSDIHDAIYQACYDPRECIYMEEIAEEQGITDPLALQEYLMNNASTVSMFRD
jgi:hypothetical protein